MKNHEADGPRVGVWRTPAGPAPADAPRAPLPATPPAPGVSGTAAASTCLTVPADIAAQPEPPAPAQPQRKPR
jgi:hypothetical protein